LGDAFEYLLSVLAHRATPDSSARHATSSISWLRVIDPKKSETVLDPACGGGVPDLILQAHTQAQTVMQGQR